MEYKNRFILFIDILGFRDFIKNTPIDQHDPSLMSFVELIKFLRSELNVDPNNHIALQRKLNSLETSCVTQFSDSIVISVDYHVPEQFDNLVSDIINIICIGYYYNFLFRGAITYGEIIHNDKLMFGPGFNKAYDMEQKLATYPRVVIDPDSFENNINTEVASKVIKEDFDGVKYIDPLVGMKFVFRDLPLQDLIIEGLEKIISNNEKADDFIKPKYTWLKKKLDQYRAYDN